MIYIGKGMASLGIGLAVACIGWKDPTAGFLSMFFAIFCLLAIWGL